MPGESYSLKPGNAFRRISGTPADGEWEIEMLDEEALKTAVPAGECWIDGAKCVDFRDAQGREWAQTKVMARDK